MSELSLEERVKNIEDIVSRLVGSKYNVCNKWYCKCLNPLISAIAEVHVCGKCGKQIVGSHYLE